MIKLQNPSSSLVSPYFSLVCLGPCDPLIYLTNSMFFSESRPNSTRFKESILHNCKGLQAHKCGREVLLIFEEDVGHAIMVASEMSNSQEGTLKAASKIIRKDVIDHKIPPFEGSFSDVNFAGTVPPSLLSFISSILRGTEKQIFQAALTIAQLIKFNTLYYVPASTRNNPSHVNHRESNATPVTIYLGLLIHSHHRDKKLIEELFRLGLCIGYQRVLAISAALGNAGVDRFIAEGVVYPSNMSKYVFTTSQLDNIDHDP